MNLYKLCKNKRIATYRYILIRKQSTSETTQFILKTKAKQINVFMVHAAYRPDVFTIFIYTLA